MGRESLVEAANILDIGEFEVLRQPIATGMATQLLTRSWNGPIYTSYMQASHLPAFAQLIRA